MTKSRARHFQARAVKTRAARDYSFARSKIKKMAKFKYLQLNPTKLYRKKSDLSNINKERKS